jgi:predicted methyltransferase
MLTLLVAAGCGGGAASAPVAASPSAAQSPSPAPSASSAPAPAPAAAAGATDGDVALSPDILAVVAASDRGERDRALDAGRHPAALLAFCGVQPGAKVAEIAAGGGYTTELLARRVGPTGKVWGENPKGILERFAEKPWSARLAKPVNANVVRVDRELDSPLPPDVTGLDLVVDNLFYHDTVWLNVDRGAMNKAILGALRPGGAYCIIDHSAKAGAGVTDAKTLHRIEESVVIAEVQKAGFKLDAESKTWRNESDARDWSASPSAAQERRGTSDRFALRFVKP